MLNPHTFNGNTQIAAAGRFFLYQASDAAVVGVDPTITVYVDGRSLGTFTPGDSIELDGQASRWEVLPESGAITGQVIIGDGTIRSARVSGTVEVIDSSVTKSLAGRQFYRGTTRTVGGFVAGGIHAMTKRFVVRRIRIKVSAATVARWYVTSSEADAATSPQSSTMRNKLLSDSANVSDAEQYTCSFAAHPPGALEITTVVQLESLQCRAGEWEELPITTPLILGAGNGLLFAAGTAGLTLDFECDGEQVD